MNTVKCHPNRPNQELLLILVEFIIVYYLSGQKFALLETKIVISTFIQHYQVISLEEEDALEPCGELVLRAKNGIKVKIIERTRRS